MNLMIFPGKNCFAQFSTRIVAWLLLNFFICLATYSIKFYTFHNPYYRRATKGREGGRPLLPFFENQKKCHDFGKKCPDCVHP